MELAITRDKRRLEELEVVIQRNLQSFYEVGRALMEIRDNQLYQHKNGGVYQTFEAYCRGVWDMSKVHAYRLMDSCRVVEAVKSNQLVTPATESQARPLARLEPEQQKQAWQKAVETAPEGKVTAAHVQKVVREMVEGPKKPEAQAGAEPEALFHLKTWWRRATKKDRKAFMAWVKEGDYVY